MTQSKGEKAVQKELLDKHTGWPKQRKNLYISKTHEMLSSGKPDLRIGDPTWGALDIELKYKTTTHLGTDTGLSVLQRITIESMNEAGMPAVVMVWSAHDKKWYLTLDINCDLREGHLVHWIDPVYKRVPDLGAVYQASKELLRERGYSSHNNLRIG